MNFEAVQGPINYVHVQIPQFDKIFHFFGDIHQVGTHCTEKYTTLHHLVDYTLKYNEHKEDKEEDKEDKIEIYYELGLGNTRLHVHNTYIAQFLRFFNKKGCFYQPRDVQCEIEYPNARFHSIDYRETIKIKINNKIKKMPEMYDISTIKNLIFEEMIPFLQKYQREGFVIEKEFIFLNFILHILGENPEKHKNYIYNSSLNFAGALYILIKDPLRMRMYIDVKDGNKMKKIPRIDESRIDTFFLFYPYYDLYQSIDKLDSPVKNSIYELIRQRIRKWDIKPSYSKWLRENNFDINAYALDECSELLDFYVLIRLFKSSQKRVILYMGSDHVRSIIHLLESLSINDLLIREFVKEYEVNDINDIKEDIGHNFSQCIYVPVLKSSILPVLSMNYIIMDKYEKVPKNIKINRFHQLENVDDIRAYSKYPGKIGMHFVDSDLYNKYLHLPKEKQLEMIKIEDKDMMISSLSSLSSLSFRPKGSKKSVRKNKKRKSLRKIRKEKSLRKNKKNNK